jgi:XTP/dITP diphosphohydrolase
LIEDHLLIATTNRSKAKEIQAFFTPLPIKISHLGTIRLETTFPENKHTFMENARDKSLFYSRFWPGLTLAEDSGLEIEHLGGAPGVLSARFSGPQATDEKNIQKVLELMREVPASGRKARFVSAFVLSRKESVIKEITECVDGIITTEKKGRYGFGYDPIFYYPPLGKTFAQLRPEEKNKISHRGRALKKLKKFLTDYLEKTHAPR